MASNAARSSPRDAQVMAQILKDAGIVEYEQRVINQMIEFAFRQVADTLDEAKVYSQHASKKNIDLEDVKLAIQVRTDHYFTNPPPRDLLQEIARQKNSQPLPPIKPYGGPRLLPDRYCLTAPNFRTKTSKKPVQQPRIQFGLQPQQRISLTGQKGIVKTIGGTPGQSITMVPKQGSSAAGQVTIISKPATLPTPKPTIRINTGPAVGMGASGLAQLVTQSLPSSLATTSLISTASTSVPSAGVLSLATPGTTITVNPLKRKLEDDDYDI